ncbi:MAG: hypothetical protein J6C55_04315 [Oscillospiraceae bacterium]|nr:hypothetical protein [Oscillospiraceae bacterium]
MKVENLIKAPKLTGKFYDIDKALKSVAGENIVLKYPKSGDYRSPFVLCDIDNDNEDEAIVFYLDDENNIKFNVLDKISNKWTSIFSTVGPGVDVEKILISDIVNNNTNQIIVNWIKPNGIDHSLQVYNYEKNGLKCIYNKDYLTDVFMFDLDNDSKDELIVVDKTLKITPKIEVIKKIDESGELEKIFYVKLMSPSSGNCKKITMGKVVEGVNAIFLDSQIEDFDTDNTINYTEIICFNKNKELKNLIFDKDKDFEINQVLGKTIRSEDIFCKDIDLDNIIEVPTSLSYHLGSDQKTEIKDKILSLTVWQKYRNGGLEISNLSVENLQDGYSFVFPDNWFKINQYQVVEPLVIAFYNEKNKEIIFKTNDQDLNEIMSIKILELSDEIYKNTDKSLDQYFELERKNNFVYYVKINNQNNNLKISLRDIKKYFSITYRR